MHLPAAYQSISQWVMTLTAVGMAADDEVFKKIDMSHCVYEFEASECEKNKFNN